MKNLFTKSSFWTTFTIIFLALGNIFYMINSLTNDYGEVKGVVVAKYHIDESTSDETAYSLDANSVDGWFIVDKIEDRWVCTHGEKWGLTILQDDGTHEPHEVYVSQEEWEKINLGERYEGIPDYYIWEFHMKSCAHVNE